MSLEAVIQENTAAIRELIARLAAAPAIPTLPEAKTVTKEEKENLGKPAQKPAASPAPTPPTAEVVQAAAPAPKAENSAPAEGELQYERDVKRAFLDLCRDKGTDTGKALLAEFKVAKATELATEQWSAFVARAKALQEA